MSMTVNDRSRSVATFRFIEVRLMEIVAGWTPTTPEMEVKVVFGRHIWDFAQHADALGKRTFELRQPMHYTLAPHDSYLSLLASAAAQTETAERLAALYDVVLPGLRRRYTEYIAKTDPILDEPTIVILERIVKDLDRQRPEAHEVLADLGIKSASLPPLATQESAIAELTAAR